MKTLLSAFALMFFAIATHAQNISTDTTQARSLRVQAKVLESQNYYDSALQCYRLALPLYEKHALWEEYLTVATLHIKGLTVLSRLNKAKSLGELYVQRAKEKLPASSSAKASLTHGLGVVFFIWGNMKKP